VEADGGGRRANKRGREKGAKRKRRKEGMKVKVKVKEGVDGMMRASGKDRRGTEGWTSSASV
jgi:hypothetical protein